MYEFCSHMSWVRIPVLPLSSCATLSTLVLKLQLPHFCSIIHFTILLEFLQGLKSI